MKKWDNDSCISLKAEKERIRKNILDLDCLEEERGLSRADRVSRESLMKDFQLVAIKEETLWRQRFQINWLKEGVQNSKFFYKVASHSKNSNDICGLM